MNSLEYRPDVNRQLNLIYGTRVDLASDTNTQLVENFTIDVFAYTKADGSRSSLLHSLKRTVRFVGVNKAAVAANRLDQQAAKSREIKAQADAQLEGTPVVTIQTLTPEQLQALVDDSGVSLDEMVAPSSGAAHEEDSDASVEEEETIVRKRRSRGERINYTSISSSSSECGSESDD
jgi:hypothetical protein